MASLTGMRSAWGADAPGTRGSRVDSRLLRTLHRGQEEEQAKNRAGVSRCISGVPCRVSGFLLHVTETDEPWEVSGFVTASFCTHFPQLLRLTRTPSRTAFPERAVAARTSQTGFGKAGRAATGVSKERVCCEPESPLRRSVPVPAAALGETKGSTSCCFSGRFSGVLAPLQAALLVPFRRHLCWDLPSWFPGLSLLRYLLIKPGT